MLNPLVTNMFLKNIWKHPTCVSFVKIYWLTRVFPTGGIGGSPSTRLEFADLAPSLRPTPQLHLEKSPLQISYLLNNNFNVIFML